MGAWHIFKTVAAKKAGEFKSSITRHKSKEKVDNNLPFGIRLNSSISLDQTHFIVYENELNMDPPGKSCIVEAYGKADISGSVVHRFYLADTENENNQSMLQVITSGRAGEHEPRVEECRLFKTLDEIFPQSEDEWGFWLDDADGYIGWHLFEDKNQTRYQRVWGEDDRDKIPPVSFSETVYFDPQGNHTTRIDSTGMLYGRWINEEDNAAELLLLSTEASNDDQALVHIYTGVDLIPGSFTVNY